MNISFHLLKCTPILPTRVVTGDNYSSTRFDKLNSQGSICNEGPKIWNELPADIKNIA